MELILIPAMFLILANLKTIIRSLKLKEVENKLKNTPYVWGGTTINGFDCSGFTQYVYKNYFDQQILRTAAQQANQSKETNNPIAGDLIFFSVPGSSNISHVGIYISNEIMLHSGSSTGVGYANYKDGYWGQRFRFFGKM